MTVRELIVQLCRAHLEDEVKILTEDGWVNALRFIVGPEQPDGRHGAVGIEPEKKIRLNGVG